MFIALGVLTGFLGFLPMFFALRLSRRSTSTQALTIGLYGLVACGLLAREGLISYVIAEILTFLVSTIAFVLYKNVLAKRKRR